MKSKMKSQLNLVNQWCMVALIAGSIPASHAAVLASDDFSTYPTVNINGANGGTGWNGGWEVGAPGIGYLNDVRTASPLSYANYEPNGGNYANFASGYGGPSFNYVQRTVDVVGAFSAYSDGTRVGLDNTSLWGSYLYNNTAGFEFWLQGAANSTISVSPTTGSNSLYLYNINFGAGNVDSMSIWINPNLATWTPSAPPTTTLSGNFAFQTLVFVVPNNENEARIDNVLLGAQAIDVVPYTVPEPSSFLLAGIAGLGLCFRRRVVG